MTCKEYTRDFLVNVCGCQEDAYENTPLEMAVKDLKEYQEEHKNTYEYPIMDIASCLIEIGEESMYKKLGSLESEWDIEAFMKKYCSRMNDELEDVSGCYQSQWGIADFYEECEKKIRKLLESGKDFRVCGGSKKEIDDFEAAAIGKYILIRVNNYIDDLSDIIYGELENESEEEANRLHDEIEESLEEEYEGTFSKAAKVERDISYDDFCEKLEEMEEKNMNDAEDHYQWLVECIRENIKYYKESKQ